MYNFEGKKSQELKILPSKYFYFSEHSPSFSPLRKNTSFVVDPPTPPHQVYEHVHIFLRLPLANLDIEPFPIPFFFFF